MSKLTKENWTWPTSETHSNTSKVCRARDCREDQAKKQLEYKGYLGSVEVNVEEKVLVGKLLFIQDVIAYSAKDINGLEREFRKAVDDYLQTCKKLGDEPNSARKAKKTKGKKAGWVVQLEEDPETGDLICPLPDEMLAKLKWKEGDTLDWVVDKETGNIILRKVS